MDNQKNGKPVDVDELKAIRDNPNTPAALRKSIEKKLKYINKPIRKTT